MNNIDEYYLSNIGRTESFISIEFIKILQKLDTNEFIKIYKISNFWKGKIFIKRLINKNFKYKLNQRMIWDSKFWDKIDIQIIKSRIHFKKETCNEKFFSKLKPKRRKDILKYQLMIKNDIDLGFPLFISGACLNQIGEKKINEKEIYMLDGSRRLTASLLNGIEEIKILLISLTE